MTTRRTGLANKEKNIIQHSEHGYDRVFYNNKNSYYICDRNEITENDCYSRHKRKGNSPIFDPVRVVLKKTIRACREIMNTPKGMECDHINGQTEDLRKENLRNCTKIQNKANTLKGVGRVKRIKGGRYTIEFPKEVEYDARKLIFDTEEEAKERLRELQIELFGDCSYERSQEIAQAIETFEFTPNEWVDKKVRAGILGKILELPPDNPLNTRVRDLIVAMKKEGFWNPIGFIKERELINDYFRFVHLGVVT